MLQMHNYTSHCTLLKKLVQRGGITQVRGHHLALMQVALIAASCCAAPIRSMVVVVVVVACCWCILYRLALMLALTFGPCVLTFAPCVLTFAPCLWCFPSFNWCNHSTCTSGGCHQSQLALVVLFYSATGTTTALALGQLIYQSATALSM